MVLLTTSVLVAQQNLVFNPGFENGTTEWTVMNSGNISTIQTDRQEGGWCCRIGADWGGVTQTVPVTANTFYNLSFWSKRLSSASNNVYVHVRCLNNADTILFKVLNGANLASTAWTQISKIFITPATTSQLEIFIYGDYGPCNTTLIDNFSLISSSTPVAVPVPASGNLLINGGFEAATPVGWTGGAIDKSTFRSGAQGLRVESAGTAYQDIAGTSENYYHADGFFKSGLSAGTSTFMVSALSQSKELLSTDSIIFTAISGFVSRSISFYTPVNTSFIRVIQ